MTIDAVDHRHAPPPSHSQDASAGTFVTTQETLFQPSTIAPELWLTIFTYLPPAGLRAVTLTCSSFRWLAQPLLFTVIDISPFFLAYSADRRIYRPRRYLDRTTERLDFYRSPHIAPAVTHCWVSPYSRTGFPARNPRDNLDPELIINKVMEALPCFPNLRHLSWHCIDFTANWWDTVRRLPLRSLWLNSCTIEGICLGALPVQHLDLDQWAWEGEVTNHVSIHEEHSSGVSQPILSVILHSDHIQHISVPRSDTCGRLLATMAAMNTLTSLRRLGVPVDAMASPYFIIALERCPALEELRIFNPFGEDSREIRMDYLPPHALPLLSIYEGPYTQLLDFGMGRSLKKALIWGQDETPSYCSPSQLVQVLRRLSLFNPTLGALHVSVARITVELLNVISSFHLLQSVEVASSDSASPLEVPLADGLQRPSGSPLTLLYRALRSARFPPKLENLRIITKLNHGNLDKHTQEREASTLIESMAHAHPMLRNIEIGYGTYWTGTYNVRWSRLGVPTDSDDDVLGRLHFTEHRRTIVFPDAQRAASEADNVNVGHSKFLAEASPAEKWPATRNDASTSSSDDVGEGKNKVLPTSSHLFKLILSLKKLPLTTGERDEPHPQVFGGKPAPPTIFLLHPSQPLSHVSRLILASISPAEPVISFRSTSRSGRIYQWSDSTDFGDFIKNVARASKFSICFTYNPRSSHHALAQSEGRVILEGEENEEHDDDGETIIVVEIPTFADRTRFLLRRLDLIKRKLESMEGLKHECDREAQRGARRLAMGGFGMLVVYWAAVARLTFWDYGWDIMEPITYLSGLSTVICGYLWFLYQGREVSYSSVLHRSISTRREMLYKARGFDIDQWADLMGEARSLRKQIARIAEDYEEQDEQKQDQESEQKVRTRDEADETRRTGKQRGPDSELQLDRDPSS
ncbi:putative mitochondrial calcium uniporter [Lyophyllum shimeji]|uniref:Calcium uniporter protein, mitochondrial n=1 Tax=Lyophyllum shimeji TaxID=47721 RepID=A0A9P3UJU0_LYOSH|nr:putative mitochondrial calcium uniporter [Lyophyllum shimeji]